MSIWKKEFDLDRLNDGKINMLLHLDINIIAFGDDYIIADMPVDHRTQQPFGVLHGGASVVLAESVGSLGGFLCLEDPNLVVVGQSINANHLRPVRKGRITAKAYPVHLGMSSQVWQIDISDEEDKMICTSRLTLSIITKPSRATV